jgi:DNA gyrase subunit B
MTTPEPLAPLEAIRKRPGMYIGDPHDGSGLHHMVWEVVANAIDEHLAGHCRAIDIVVEADGSISIEDDGRGFPMDEVEGTPFAQRALTTFHDTATLDGHAYHLHVVRLGVGVFPVCALSSWLELEVHRDGRRRSQRFERGLAVSPVRDLGATDQTGTRLAFLPDPEVLDATRFDSGVITRRIEELARLLSGLKWTFADRRVLRFDEPEGLASFVRSPPARLKHGTPFVHRAHVDDVLVEVAAAWRWSHEMVIDSFANIERTQNGTHVRGLVSGLAVGLREAAATACSDDPQPTLEHVVKEGLRAVVCVRLADPSYGSPCHDLLTTPRIEGVVRDCVAKEFAVYLAHAPKLLEAFVTGVHSRRSNGVPS